jgi:membrane fusion protein
LTAVAQLFRAEVLAHRQQSWIGDVQVVRPPSLGLLTALAVGVALAVAAFFVFAQYTKKARLDGFLAVVDDGVQRPAVAQPAVVVEALVREGQRVRAGQPLFVLSTDVATRAGGTQAAVQSSLARQQLSLRDSLQQQAALADAARADLERRIAETAREAEQLVADIALGHERVALVQTALERVRGLQDQNFVSYAQVQAKTEEVLAARQQLAALERQRAARQRDVAALRVELVQQPLVAGMQRERTERELQQLDQQRAELAARHELVLKATHDAVVTGVFAAPGQSAAPHVPLAHLLPVDAKLQAHLFAPSSAIGFVGAEQPVRLRYHAFPYQKFGQQAGRVLSVSRTPLQADEVPGLSPAAARAAREPLYRITVELDRQTVQAYGGERALSPGMQLEADVLLDRRRLIEWVFEPVISAARKV